MSFVKDTFFGGAEKKASKAQTEALGRAQDYVEESAAEAKADVNRLFPEAQQAIDAGFGEALDVFTSGVSPRLNTFKRGNMNAQETIAAGMPQIQNALLGRPVDMSYQTSKGLMPTISYLTERDMSAFAPPEKVVDPAPYTLPENLLTGVDFSRLPMGLGRHGLNLRNR